MAIYSAVPPPHEQPQPHSPAHHHQLSSAPTASVDIDAWTVSALQSLSISPRAVVGTGNPLSIPLDDNDARQASRMKLRHVTIDVDATGEPQPPRKLPRRRDSMDRREALLKGKEGSRQRRRWENDRLLHIPNVEPPTPADWDVRPTHPVHHVPYQLAQFWDQKVAGLREQQQQRRGQRNTAAVPVMGRVPRDLHAKAKRTPAVKSWLRVLEEPVREFLLVERGEAAAVVSDDSSSSGSLDSEDEEIVFVGRNGSMTDARGWKKAAAAGRRDKMKKDHDAPLILDSLGDDESASFKRWLTHSISDYYGLDSRSVEIGTPAKKVVYIGVKQVQPPTRRELPRPLWEMF